MMEMTSMRKYRTQVINMCNPHKIINKLINIFYAYIIIFFISIIHPGKMNSEGGENNAEYIPKRMRKTNTNLLANKYTFKMIRNCTEWVWQSLECMQNRMRVKRRRMKAKKMACPKPKGRFKGIKSIVAFPIVAMPTKDQISVSREQRIVNTDTDSDTIGIDNRCSACISHRIEDFIGNPVESKRTIRGFGGTHTKNIMMGTLKWSWLDDNGQSHTFHIPNSYYVPHGSVRLLSPQHWAQTQSKGRRNGKNPASRTYHDRIVLGWNNGENQLTVPISKRSNVATFHMSPGYNKFSLFCKSTNIEYEKDICYPMTCLPVETEHEIEDEETNSENMVKLNWPEIKQENARSSEHLQGPTKSTERYKRDSKSAERSNGSDDDTSKLLRIHQKYGHISFHRLREMANQGIINKRYSQCKIPVCSACLYAKATRKKWRDKGQSQYNKKETQVPGQCVSVDQMVSPTPGLVAQITGKLTTKRYKYATIFVDQATRMGYTYLQSTASADETITAKKAFEAFARQHGVTIRGYHADNGIFKANKWMESCRSQSQSLTFAGVNAHHQNGVAERRIRTLQELTRAMLIHANKLWPEAISANLWPYALRMANDYINETPNMQDASRRSSLQLFSNSNIQSNVKHAKTFGCPCYVLDNSLQSGSIFHKWNQRARVGIYIGRSPQHARNVSLVLDRNSGLVSPQFHVEHDNEFDTVKQEKYECKWQLKAGFISIKHDRKSGTEEDNRKEPHSSKKRKRIDRRSESDAQGSMHLAEYKERTTIQNNERDQRARRREELRERAINNQTEDDGRDIDNETAEDQDEIRNTRTPEGEIRGHNDDKLANSNANQDHEYSDPIEIFSMEAMYPSELPEVTDPLLAYKAVADPDVMYLHQAMKEKDRDMFIEAMRKEVKDQAENGNFSIVRKDTIPKGKNVLKAVWQMRRKRDIKTRAIKKYKARLNIDGSRMIRGIDYDETYAPVASWKTIRLLLTLALSNNWHTRQLDYVLAFPQAPAERDLYMEIPKGFKIDEGKSDDYVLQIHRNIYGQKQAGRVWNQYLVDKLVNNLGFKQSKVDECLFYKGSVLYALYTDDSILVGPDKSEIDKIIQDMVTVGLKITDEGTLEDFLGVNITKQPNGSFELKQPHLVDQILEDLKMTSNVKEKPTPAPSSKILTHQEDSEPFDKSFHYRSVIGKLNYLEKSTRPDISYATHQCARFTENPRKAHAQAVRWLARYLKATKDKGIIIAPDKNKDLEMFVDADFSGNWKKEEAHIRDSARSRHGYVITYQGCPLLWKSQLQTEIALSSTESEYIGISHGLRDVIPIIEILKELNQYGFDIGSTQGKVRCRVFEDNSGAIEMARVHKYRPRTKHVNVKYHHFRDYVDRGEITVSAINTKEQPADILTKPVNEATLQKHRKSIMGW